jgi:hypothetical protein
MEDQLSRHDLATLRTMHEKLSADLQARLISGALWHEVRDLKKKVVDLAIAIHKKANVSRDDRPAAFDPGNSKDN